MANLSYNFKKDVIPEDTNHKKQTKFLVSTRYKVVR